MPRAGGSRVYGVMTRHVMSYRIDALNGNVMSYRIDALNRHFLNQ